ncbi:MAG TPA: DUF2059 domain-containing protein [Flavobacterium sp.]|nr:DUF2059 domain-containing protein [Flavobacterium sp.]
MMKKYICLIVFAFITSGVFAQANKNDVQKLVELSGELQEIYSIGEQLSKQLSVENRASFKKDLTPLIESQKNKLIAYYSQNLSQDEVDKLIVFYESPLAKKYLMIRKNYKVVLSNNSDAFKEEMQGIIMKYMMYE